MLENITFKAENLRVLVNKAMKKGGFMVTKNGIDLHMHSYYSDDGEFSPEELVQKCRELGVGIMAIADHNCVRANAAAQRKALEAGIIYIPAIEIDCTFNGTNLHVLGYGIDYNSPDFEAIENNISEQSSAASRKMLLATQKLGFDISESDMVSLAANMYWKDRWTGEMFAEVLLSKPEYGSHSLLSPYRPGGLRSDNPYVNFYWDFYSQGKPCYAEMVYPPLGHIIDIIHRNGGKAVLAHPGVYAKDNSKLLKDIAAAGIDGIEAFSSYHSPSQCQDFYREAKDNNLFVTCGSDYHGKTKPAISIGGHGCFLSEEEMSLNIVLPL